MEVIKIVKFDGQKLIANKDLVGVVRIIMIAWMIRNHSAVQICWNVQGVLIVVTAHISKENQDVLKAHA